MTTGQTSITNEQNNNKQRYIADTKLYHCIRKIVNLYSSSDQELTTEFVQTLLLQNHKEYRRKSNAGKLQRDIESVLQSLVKPETESAKKRRRNSDCGVDSPSNEDDQQEEEDVNMTEQQQPGRNALNASLRARYTQQNEERMEKESASTTRKAENGGKTNRKKKKRIIKKPDTEEYENAGTKWSIAPADPRPKQRYSDMGGIQPIISQIRELVEYPLLHPETFAHLGVIPPRGVLLTGPSGCGKTHLAMAVGGELDTISFMNVSAPEIIGGVSGESERRVRTLFETAESHAPSVVFIDELDSVISKRSGSGSTGNATMEKRIIATFLSCMDNLPPSVMILATTNRPEALDASLRRAGRFDREIALGVPDDAARMQILRKVTGGMRLEGGFDYGALSKKIPGYVGADMVSLTREAAILALNRFRDSTPAGRSLLTDAATRTPLTSEQMEPLYITFRDFTRALPKVQPSSKREGFATVPDVSWDNVGALHAIREELTLSIIQPITHPERFKALGLPLPAGVMLYGPPGCGKTLLAKAIANQSGANFISVKGPELLDKYVGESERSVRLVFERARSSQPCIVFFDELDSLCPKRGSGNESGNVTERVVNQLLTEMDGLESRNGVFVIAATNRPELIDPAMLRPGRLDKLLYVPLPTPEDRVSILTALAKGVQFSPDVDLRSVAVSKRADGYSGADCAALLREAGLAVLRDSALNDNGSPPPLQITPHHFEYAFCHVMPSVSKMDQVKYDRMRMRIARARTRGGMTLDRETSTMDDCPALDSNVDKDGSKQEKI